MLSQDGKIDEKYALADYSLDFVESNAPQPKGYFIYVPECLMEMNPSNIYVITERELFINAAAANPDASKLNRVIKYVSKTDLVHLLVLLGGTNVKVQEFKPKSNTFEENSPFIHLETRLDKNGQTVYTLRAKDAHGAGIKLSIRKFIPEFTHDTISVSSPDFSAKLTTNALFGRMLFNVSQWTNANKFSQLRQNDQLKFTQDADGDYVYNQFTDSYTVDAYDQNKNSKHTTTVYLPFVKETVSSSGTTRTVFSKSKFNEDGGNYKVALYRRDIEAVGDQINRTKKRTAKSMNNSLTSQLHVQEGLLSLVSGNQINIK